MVKFQIENNLNPNCPFKLMTDSVKLEQILINLISNAIKFTNEGQVILSLFLSENTLKFEVKDSGVGMSEEQVKRIETPFNIVNRTQNKYGAGLGLYLVTQMLMQLDSCLEVKSIEGKGTSFCFNLKINSLNIEYDTSCQINHRENNLNISCIESVLNETVANNDAILIQEADKTKYLDHPEEDFSKSYNSFSKSFIDRELQFNESEYPDLEFDYYILVDDESIVRRSSVRILLKAAKQMNRKIKIIESEDGIECISLLYKLSKRGFKIKAIISDENMNHMNGTHCAYIIRNIIKNLNIEKIQFYLLTAFVKVVDSSISQLFTKPLNLDSAFRIIESQSLYDSTIV